MTESCRQLAAEWFDYTQGYARSLRNVYPKHDHDDLELWAMGALLELASKYGGEGDFRKLLNATIHNRIIDKIRVLDGRPGFGREDRIATKRKVRQALRNWDDSGAKLFAVQDRPSPSERLEIWRVACRGLSKKERLALLLMFEMGMSQYEASPHIGFTPGSGGLSGLLKRIRPLVKNNLRKYWM